MKHLHRNVISTGLVWTALVVAAYALLGIGFAAIIAVGLFVVSAILLVGLVLFEEETHLPWWEDARQEHEHGYHPIR